MKSLPPFAWFLPAALLTLCVVPVVGGAVRLITVALGVEVIPGNDRFFAAPPVVTIHIVTVSLFCVFGAFQMSGPIRRRKPAWHRRMGRVLVPVGMTAALSGLWLTFVYPPGEFDGPDLVIFRVVFGTGMAVFLWLGFAAIRRHDIEAHRAWMIRAFAIALGAGTQVFTHVPLELYPHLHGELGRLLAMVGGWALNLAIAEWIIHRRRSPKSHTSVAAS